jgi:hypothetical protein
MRQEIYLTDLGKLANPQEHAASIRVTDKWEVVPYETSERSGTLLAAVKNVKPDPVTFTLGLTGWYRIYVCLPGYGSFGSYAINLQLTNDKSYAQLCPSGQAHGKFEEIYWKSADLTGQDITLSKFKTGIDHDAMLAWLRFVPMSDDEIAAYKHDQQRRDTKRIYATHDMHGHLYLYDPQKAADWYCIVENYRDSDVASFSMENVMIFDGDPAAGDPDNQGYYRPGDRNVQKGLKPNLTFGLLNNLVHYGHDMGLEMYLSMRMGAWGIEFPYDQMYFANKFANEHPELRCFDRLGAPAEAMSYLYPEVQDYLIDIFAKMAETDCDGVEMIFTRGVPYVLYEQPFIDLFRSRYGDLDPRRLPIADKRVHGLFCEVMTGFVARLRKRLDDVRAACNKKPVKLIARVHASIENGRLVGIDVAEWARQKLIDVIVSYPMFIAENMDADVWADEERTLLDLDKYRQFVQTSPAAPVIRQGNFDYEDVTELIKQHHNGDPLTEEERIASFKALGLPVFFEILPRQMPTEEYKRRALRLYERGAEGISLWDTYNRVPNRQQWTMVRRLGHKDELAQYSSGEGDLYRYIPVLRINGQNISLYKPMWGG